MNNTVRNIKLSAKNQEIAELWEGIASFSSPLSNIEESQDEKLLDNIVEALSALRDEVKKVKEERDHLMVWFETPAIERSPRT